ncbi:MAG: glycosyltransferase family 39 protein [Chloroflexota bacterium]|nr:glycosyltransferase family 39 protein [Chloroflexota bacterium]
MRRISGYSSIAVLLLAFILRAYHLGFQASLSDDALGLVLARRNPLDLLAVTASEPFPPTFYVSLSLWTRLAGGSEFAGRFYSVLFSMLSVALMYVAGRRLIGGQGGVVSAFLLAINPFDIFFAQEVRMYTMVVLFSLASSIFAFDLLTERRKPWVAYAVTTLVAVMTHAFALFVLFAQDVAALAVGPRAWRWLRSWAISQLAVIAAFALWLALVATKLQAYNNALVGSLPLASMFWRTVTAYGLGFSAASGAGIVLPGLLAGLAGVGLAWLAVREIAEGDSDGPKGSPQGGPAVQNRQRRWPHGGGSLRGKRFTFVLCYLAVPFFAVWGISLFRPIFYERYMAVTLPPLILLAAAGVLGFEQGFTARLHARRWATWLFGVAGVVGLLAAAVAGGSQLGQYYRTVVYARSEDMRDLAAQLTSARDALVVVNVAANDPLYAYYLPARLPIVSTLAVASAAFDMPRMTAGHSTIWFLPFGSSDHQQRALGWLTANGFPMASRWYGHAQVLGFGIGGAGPRAQRSFAAPAVFGGQVELASATFPTAVAAGDPVDLTLTWRAAARPGKDYSVFVHLLNAGGSTVAQHDGWPAAGTRPTTGWRPGESIADRHGLLVPLGTSAGTYKLEVGLYDAGGQRLQLADGASSASIGEVQVRAG